MLGKLIDRESLLGLLELRHHLWLERRRAFLGLALMVVSLVTSLYLPMLNQKVFDRALPGKDIRLLIKIAMVVFVFGCVEYTVSSCRKLLFQTTALRVSAKLRTDLFRKITMIPHSEYEKFLKGTLHDIISNDVASLRFLYLDNTLQSAMTFVTLVSSVVIMLNLSIPLALLAVGISGITVAFTVTLSKRVHTASKAFVDARSALNGEAFEALGSVPLIRVCSAEEREVKRFEDATLRMAGADLALEKTTVWMSGLITTVEGLMPYVVFVVGVWLIIQGRLLLGQLVAFSMYFGKARSSVSALGGIAWQWQRLKPSLNRVLSILRMPNEDRGDKVQLHRLSRGIEARDVGVRRNSAEVLRGASLVIPCGMMIAIVGPNGGGKTTLLRVLSGLLCPDTGEVRVDGEPLVNIDKRSYRRLCGFVFQNASLPNRTIRETISYRLSEPIDDASAYQGLDRVGLKQFVQGLPQALDTRIGEMGSRISGGEMQRLAIARELVYQPQVLFLDEATNSIDAATECALLEMLGRYCGSEGMSVVFVTHYPHNLRFAELVYVVRNGRVTYSFQPDELAADDRLLRGVLGDAGGADLPS